MKSSLQDFFPVISPYVSNKLVSEKSLSQINNLSLLLPGIPTINSAGFECRLAEEQQATDILVAFKKKNRHLVSTSFEALPKLASNSHIWKRINELFKKWTNTESIVYENLDNMWLEFDIDQENDNCPDPSLFFAPFPLKLDYCEPKSSFQMYEWMIEEVLEPLLNDQISIDTRDKLSQCFNFLPPGGEVFQVGIMLPRISESKAIRLCIKGIEVFGIVPYLESIGWVDPTDKLTSMLQELSSLVDYFAFNISIEDDIHPKIGIECYIHQEPSFMQKWYKLLSFMCEKNICSYEKISSVLEWPGYVEERFFTDVWPGNFSQASRFVYPSLRSSAARAISHVKIVYEPMTSLQAKVYLWFGHRWIKPDGALHDC